MIRGPSSSRMSATAYGTRGGNAGCAAWCVTVTLCTTPVPAAARHEMALAPQPGQSGRGGCQVRPQVSQCWSRNSWARAPSQYGRVRSVSSGTMTVRSVAVGSIESSPEDHAGDAGSTHEHQVGIGNLVGRLTADLAHGLEQMVEAVHVSLRKVAARGVHGERCVEAHAVVA